jgi:hypothetical protein
MKTSSLSQTISRYFLLTLVAASLGNLLACQSDTIEPKPQSAPEIVHIINQDSHAVPRPYVDRSVSDSTKRVDPQPRPIQQDQ